MSSESIASESSRPSIVRLRVRSSQTDSILHAFVARDKIVLADVSVNPTEEVRSIAEDLVNREPNIGWDALSVRRAKIKGLRFHVYELMQGDSPQIWTFACVYDSTHIKKKTAQNFLQKIVSLTELQRYCDETWRNGEYRACRDSFAPTLFQHMLQVDCSGEASDNMNLDYSKRTIQANRKVLNEIKKRKKETEKKLLKDMDDDNDELEEDNTTAAFSVKEVYLDITTSTGSFSDESVSGIFSDPVRSPASAGRIKKLKLLTNSSLYPLATKREAARLIQKQARGFLVRRQYTSLTASIVRIQSGFRGHACRKRVPAQFPSALCIQHLTLSKPQSQDNSYALKQGIDPKHIDVYEESFEDLLSASGVLEIFPEERISRSKARNPEEVDVSEEPKLLVHHSDDGKSGHSLLQEGSQDDGHVQETVSSLLTTMKLASTHNRERLDTLKKRHAHLTQSLAAGEHQDEASLQELATQRDQALCQVARVVEQLAESDAQNGHLKSSLNKVQDENAALKDQLAKQHDKRLIKRIGLGKKMAP